MLKVNLLPKEVLERRRYEGLYRWVFIAAGGLILILLLGWVWLLLVVSGKEGRLQTVQESVQQAQQLASDLSIFQNKEQELQTREAVAQTALAGRINVGQAAEDVSLVLPDEVWLDLFTISQQDGILITAQTPRTAGESNDVAYKSVAKTLVRLNELPELYDVWLTSATNSQWSLFAQPSGSSGAASPVNVVTFQATTKIAVPGASSSSATSTTTSGTASQPAAAASSAVNAANSSASGNSVTQ